MAGKPQATNATLRKLVREILVMAPGYKFPESSLFRSIRELLPANAAEDSDLLAAAEWNLANDFVTDSTNEETEEREWQITQHGIARENLK